MCSEGFGMGWDYNFPSCTACAIDMNYSNNQTFRRCVMWVSSNSVFLRDNSFLCIGIGI